jgi:glycosyltransferase involved in cell wall biosynthesis
LFLKTILLQHFLFKFFVDKFLYIGTQNKAFYQYYGVSEESRFIHTPYAVDNDFFKNQAKDLKPFKLNLLQELSIPMEKKIILFSGKYIAKKRPLDLLKAYSLLPQDLYVLVFVGEGNLRFEMEKYILNNKLKNVVLTGFINQSQIAKYYAVADVFVMCSGLGETWGLSVNEAMNFGLPVIVSETCGSAYDLVESGRNGYVFKEGNIQDLSSAIINILDSSFISAKMGQISENLIENFSNNETVENISDIINLK